jgi:hypothetical protein
MVLVPTGETMILVLTVATTLTPCHVGCPFLRKNATDVDTPIRSSLLTAEYEVHPIKPHQNHGYQIAFTLQYNPEDSSEHHTRRRENLKSHTALYVVSQLKQYTPWETY